MKIEISEGCFGPDVMVDGESLFKHEYDTRTDEEMSGIQDKVLQELSCIKGNLDMADWSAIANIITYRGKFELDESNSYESNCDQCGNWNYRNTFNKTKDGE